MSAKAVPAPWDEVYSDVQNVSDVTPRKKRKSPDFCPHGQYIGDTCFSCRANAMLAAARRAQTQARALRKLQRAEATAARRLDLARHKRELAEAELERILNS